MAEKFDLPALQKSIKEAGAGWHPGPTSLTALPPEEQALRLGYIPGPGEPSLAEREQVATANFMALKAGLMTAAVGAPASVDWRNFNGGNFVTPIKDQASCGSCVSFGTCAAVESAYRVAMGPAYAIDLSEAHLFYCLGASSGASCNNGWWVDPALNGFINPGVVDETCYPYTAHDQACGVCRDWQSRVNKIAAWHKITNAAEMKNWLATHGPLVTCFTVYNDFFSYRGGVYTHVSGAAAGGHCVCVIGYDDTQNCWICKNSWGTGWGDGGFFRIAYGQCGIDGTMWAVDSIVENKWYNNVHVLGLWAIDQDRNAYACFNNDVGWKKVAADNDNIFLDILNQLAAAKTGARPVNIHVLQGVIDQIYLL